MADSKTKAEQYYDAVEALKADGMDNADAIRQVAEKQGVSDNAVRGSIYQHRNKLNGGAPSTGRGGRRAKATTPEDELATARGAIERAIALIDREVDEAKIELDAAQARYDQVSGSVKERRVDFERRLKALS